MRKTVIALIGPSGSGKSSIGFELARRLGWEFLDSDREIERKTGMSVADIFLTLGEAEFRKKETELLEDLTKAEKLILSTGGGLPVSTGNFEKLESFATIVYLTAPLEVLVTRINLGEERPLLAGSASEGEDKKSRELQERLGKLIAERQSIYSRAQYRIDTSASGVEQLADDIIRLTGVVIPPGS